MTDAKKSRMVARFGRWGCAFALFGLTLGGCGSSLPNKIAFAGQSGMLQSGTQVNFLDAIVSKHEFLVKIQLVNGTGDVLFIDRRGFGLRLPDGRTLGHRGAIADVYQVKPGGAHRVYVKFVDPQVDMRQYQGASLLVGGIFFSSDPRPRVVGEIPLVPTGPHG